MKTSKLHMWPDVRVGLSESRSGSGTSTFRVTMKASCFQCFVRGSSYSDDSISHLSPEGLSISLQGHEPLCEGAKTSFFARFGLCHIIL